MFRFLLKLKIEKNPEPSFIYIELTDLILLGLLYLIQP